MECIKKTGVLVRVQDVAACVYSINHCGCITVVLSTKAHYFARVHTHAHTCRGWLYTDTDTQM